MESFVSLKTLKSEDKLSCNNGSNTPLEAFRKRKKGGEVLCLLKIVVFASWENWERPWLGRIRGEKKKRGGSAESKHSQVVSGQPVASMEG